MISAEFTDWVNDFVHLPEGHSVHQLVQLVEVGLYLLVVVWAILIVALVEHGQHRLAVTVVRWMLFDVGFQRFKDEAVKVTDIIDVLKHNDSLRNRLLSGIFSCFIYTCLFATCNYYLKWKFCADLSTGAINTEQYGTFMLISSMMMFLPILIGTAISVPLMSKAGSPIKFLRMVIAAEAAACGILALLHFTGLMSPVPFFIAVALCAVALGTEFVPADALAMESMDYEVYKNGRDRAATINTLGKLLGKAQSAFATAAVGATLTAVGYIVDSATDTYLGDLAAIPSLLNWFIVIMAVIPCLFGVIALLIMRKYPVTDEVRADMKAKLGK